MNKKKKHWYLTRPIAHRGLHDRKCPENSLSSFEKAIDARFPIECDVRLISDGTVVVFHDDSLQRMTGKRGKVEDLKCEDLKRFKLAGTKESIPTLEEMLELVDGRTPLLIELKNRSMTGELERATYGLLKSYSGQVAIQSFHPFSVGWFRLFAPKIPRGLLVGELDDTDLPLYQKIILENMLLAPVVAPHFVGVGQDFIRRLPLRISRKLGLPLVAWTIHSDEEAEAVREAGARNIIFEGFKPER